MASLRAMDAALMSNLTFWGCRINAGCMLSPELREHHRRQQVLYEKGQKGRPTYEYFNYSVIRIQCYCAKFKLSTSESIIDGLQVLYEKGQKGRQKGHPTYKYFNYSVIRIQCCCARSLNFQRQDHPPLTSTINLTHTIPPIKTKTPNQPNAQITPPPPTKLENEVLHLTGASRPFLNRGIFLLPCRSFSRPSAQILSSGDGNPRKDGR